MAINWQPQRVQNVSINPNAGLSTASQAFGNIAKLAADKRKADELAVYRDRAQTFAEGAPERAILEEQRLLDKSAEQGLTASEIAASTGGSRLDQTLMDPKFHVDPRAQKLFGDFEAVGPRTPEQIAALDEYSEQALAQNKRLFSDPKKYRADVERKLLESGQFGREDAKTIAAEQTSQLFPTLDKELAKAMIQKPGAATFNIQGTGGSTRRGGRDKLLFSQAGPRDEKDMIDEFKRLHDITDEQAEFQLPEFLGGGRPLDVFGVDLKGNDIAKYLADMAKTDDQGRPGVNVREALKYLQTQTRAGVTDLRIDKLSKQQLEDFRTGARNMLAGQERTFTPGGGQSTAGQILSQQQTHQDRINRYNQGILATQNPDQSTREQRLSTLLSGLPGEAPRTVQQATGAAPIDVDGVGTRTVPAPAAAVQPGILPPAQDTPATPAQEQQEYVNKPLLSTDAFRAQDTSRDQFNMATTKKVKETNAAVQKVKNFAKNEDRNPLPTVKDLKTAYNYPGNTDADRAAILKMAAKRSIRKSDLEKGFFD